jgi:uncharacterized protein YdhG (YjbR/CyaY superfamily)
MQSQAQTVTDYLNELPDDRREAISKLRAVVRKNLPKGLEECMAYGMIGYVVPHKLYPAGYHCDPKQPLPFANLASQKNYMALYLMTAYFQDSVAKVLRDGFQAAGKKLDMGKSCIRFRKIEDLPLDVVAKAVSMVSVKDYIGIYEGLRGATKESGKTVKAKTSSSNKPKKKV